MATSDIAVTGVNEEQREYEDHNILLQNWLRGSKF